MNILIDINLLVVHYKCGLFDKCVIKVLVHGFYKMRAIDDLTCQILWDKEYLVTVNNKIICKMWWRS